MAAIEVEMPFAEGRKVLGTTNEFPLGELVSGWIQALYLSIALGDVFGRSTCRPRVF